MGLLDVLCERTVSITSTFRMVAVHIVHRAERLHGLLNKVHQAEQGLHLHDRVNSALLVEPTYLDLISGSTTTWTTGSINMLSLHYESRLLTRETCRI
eukprot:5303637-Amphidinium_carterae.1